MPTVKVQEKNKRKEQEGIEMSVEVAEDNWKHRNTRMACRSCMWFVRKNPVNPDAEAHLGRCRRRSPALGGWPAVFDSDWCGSHKLDEEKL